MTKESKVRCEYQVGDRWCKRWAEGKSGGVNLCWQHIDMAQNRHRLRP